LLLGFSDESVREGDEMAHDLLERKAEVAGMAFAGCGSSPT
jgi:hypothetical protein